MRRLLESPEIFGKSCHSCRRIEHDLSAVQTERACTLGEMPVVADVHANTSERSIKTRITEIARPKIKLLPEAWVHVWNVVLAILAEVLSIGVDHRGGVVIDPGQFLFIDRHDDHHAVFLRDFLHQSHSWT